MKKLIKNKINILEIVLLLSPIIDLLTSFSQRQLNIEFSFGLVIRAFLLFFMVMFLLIKSDYKYKKITIIYLFITILYSIVYITNIYLNKEKAVVLVEIKELIKAYYFPICIITILNYMETKKTKVDDKLLFFVVLGYITLLFIPSIFNIGYESYAEDKIGNIGWFFSANEISAIYAILFIFVIFSYNYINNKFLYIILTIYSLYTVMQIGTKIPAVAALLAILAFILIKTIQLCITKSKTYIKSIIIGCILLLAFGIIFITSPVYKNFDIYKNYLISTRETEFVDSTSIEENNNEEIINNIDDNEAKTENIESTQNDDTNTQNENNVNSSTAIESVDINEDDESLTTDEIATIIHSGRAETKEKIKNEFRNSSMFQKIFGLGKINVENNSQYLSEIDYYDILFNFGYLGFVIYFMPVIAIFVIIIKKLNYKKIKEIICNDSLCCYIIAIINGLGLCAIAGHTLVAPAVSIYITIAIVELYRKFK